MLWKRICLKYETFNIVARLAISCMLCLPFRLVDVMLHSTAFCDEELRVAGFFRVTIKMVFFFVDDDELVSRSETQDARQR